MGTKNRPAPHDCYASAEGDEPLFTLLARDVHAPFLLRAWADMREASGESPDKVEEARSCADAMARWRTRRRERPPMTDEAAAQLLRRGTTVGQLLGAAQERGHEVALPDAGEGGTLTSWGGPGGAPITGERLDEGLDEVFGDLPDWNEGDEAAVEGADPPPTVAGPAAGAPVIDVQGEPSPEPARAEPKAAVIANVMRLPDPETLARITEPEPARSATAAPKAPAAPKSTAAAKAPAKPAPAAPPGAAPPGAADKEVVFSAWFTLGAPGELLLRRVCEQQFEPRVMTANVPGLGFATLTDFRVGNQRLLYGPSPSDPSVHDFFTADLHEYCVRGPGKAGLKAPRVAPSTAITLVVHYTGQVPDGYEWGAAHELRVSLRGAAVDRRML
jgi:hypothetical protein